MTETEIRAELAEIAAEATTWKGWEWAPGMLGVAPGHGALRLSHMAMRFVWFGCVDGMAPEGHAWVLQSDAVPDLTDSATIGVVFRMVCDRPQGAFAFGRHMSEFLDVTPDDARPALAWWVHALATARAAREVLR